MNYIEEIEYRKAIRSKNGKITKEEQEWCMTHVCYNELMGYPYIYFDVLNIKSNVLYKVCVNFEKNMFNGNVFVDITVPCRKGYILFDGYIIDRKGEVSHNKKVNMIEFEYCKYEPKQYVKYISYQGLIEIKYKCLKIITNPEPNKFYDISYPYNCFAMKKEIISNNKLRYYCKNPESDDDFDSIIFTVSLEPLNESLTKINKK